MDNGDAPESAPKDVKAENKRLTVQFKAQHGLVVAFFLLIFIFHALAIFLFCSGFLLTRFVLPNRSECAVPPIENAASVVKSFTPGTLDNGCWYPKTFDKAVVIVIDALRYDFTVPFHPAAADEQPHHFHNALSVLHETASQTPHNAFLRPFIADPPTTTLQRLKGLTTGTLPTFLDAGSNFAGTAIDEDNLVEQLHNLGRRVVHLGDDTWHALFPGYFEPNLTRAYDSFNVWDLHTLDNGVNEHIFPLLEPAMHDRWDVIIGHYLGVDHAGHRYGPDHPAMTDKLSQMDGVLRHVISALPDDALLVVLGDHGMDPKGDHGGESDDEVQAALWMYANRPVFGRRDPSLPDPPPSARDRPVAQVDLVPTLSLLLGLPIPFNNLGRPIEEAFVGNTKSSGPAWGALAAVHRLTAAQIHRYLTAYAAARGLEDGAMGAVEGLWETAHATWDAAFASGAKGTGAAQLAAYRAFEEYQLENLRIFKRLWAQFDLVAIAMGILALVGSAAVIALYAQGIVSADRAALTPPLLGWGLLGTAAGAIGGAAVGSIPSLSVSQFMAFGAAVGGIGATLGGLWPARQILRVPYPSTFWGGLCFLATLLLCVGFASNSFTIWEDEQLLFLLTTFGVLMLGASLGRADRDDRFLGASNAVSFLVATRLSSLSRLCREEQMPNCRSTYYASALSSTSAGWQLVIPFVVALGLPSVIRYFFIRTRNYHGSAVIWIGIALRLGLVMVAAFWTIDTADDGDWYPQVSKDLLKTSRVLLAQVVLAVTFAAGYSTFIWASPMLVVKTEKADPQPTSTSKAMNNVDPLSPVLTTVSEAPQPRSKLIIFGYANTHGTRYFLLPSAWILALLLVQKPMGQGTLALCMISILNLLEIVDANNLRRSPLGPIVLALLGSFYFFKTGHQAVIATIQWETAFIATKSIQYPISPVLVVLNTYGPQILCAIAVPAIVMWKVPPKYPGLLGRVAGSVATHLLFYAAIAVATTIEAAWLRRHLMLYRVFMPRMLVSVTSLLLVEAVSAVVAIVSVRWSMVSVADVFGWPEA